MNGSSQRTCRPLRIGHRGAAGYAPENTLASLEQAVKLGVDVVEFDVRRSVDGAVVLLHDRTVDRTTNGKGQVETLPVQILRGLDAGGGERIPHLKEALACLNGRAGAMIEMKMEGMAADVCGIVKASGFQGLVFYASFFHEELIEVRSLLADALTVALIEKASNHPTAFATNAQATHAGLALDIVTPELVQALQVKALQVFVYTVDEPEDIVRMKSFGVDGIISNFPDRL